MKLVVIIRIMANITVPLVWARYLLSATHTSFHWIPTTALGGECHQPHLTDEETELRPHSQSVLQICGLASG